MPNTKTGTTWAPDIRPGSIETFTENFTPEGGETQTATYKIVPSHPILDKVLDKMAWFRTHAGAVWYNKLEGLTLLQKIKNMENGIAIPTNANIDTYTTPGHYYSVSAAVTETLSGTPDGIVSGFSLDVKKVGSNVVHELTPVNGTRYTRGSTSAGWGVWRCLNRTLFYENVEIGDVTIPEKCYVPIATGRRALFATVATWASNSGAFSLHVSIASTSEVGSIYVAGTPNTTIKGLHVRLWNFSE